MTYIAAIGQFVSSPIMFLIKQANSLNSGL